MRGMNLTMTLIVFLFACSVLSGCGSASAENVQQELDRVAAKLQTELPKMMDENTQLREIRAGTMEIRYSYVFVNHSSAQIDRAAFESGIREKAAGALCPMMKPLMSKGVSTRVSYAANDEVVMAEVLLTPSDCGF